MGLSALSRPPQVDDRPARARVELLRRRLHARTLRSHLQASQPVGEPPIVRERSRLCQDVSTSADAAASTAEIHPPQRLGPASPTARPKCLSSKSFRLIETQGSYWGQCFCLYSSRSDPESSSVALFRRTEKDLPRLALSRGKRWMDTAMDVNARDRPAPRWCSSPRVDRWRRRFRARS